MMKSKLLKVIVLMAVCVVYFKQVCTQSLQYVSKIALDRNRDLNQPYHVRSVYARFINTEAIWVQLWKAKDVNLTEFTLTWQVLLQPRYGNGSAEVIELSEEEMIVIQDPDLRIGVLNRKVPGPVLETYKYGNGVVLSLSDVSDQGAVNINASVYFDDLLLPYHIPVFFCNISGCPNYLENEPVITPKPETTAEPSTARGGDSYLHSAELMLGLLAWNGVLTVLLFGLLVAVICVCHDVEKLRRKQRRYANRSRVGGHLNADRNQEGDYANEDEIARDRELLRRYNTVPSVSNLGVANPSMTYQRVIGGHLVEGLRDETGIEYFTYGHTLGSG